MTILSDNVLKKIQFLLYALVMLLVSFSCAHKKQSPDLAPTENSIVEKEVQVTNFFGILLQGKDVASIVKMMEEKVDVFSLDFMTSQKSKEAIAALAKGLSSYYGECHQNEQDEMDDYFRWAEVLLRPVHSDEGGMTVIFY